MKLNREGVQLNAEERNKRNQNWATLEDEVSQFESATTEFNKTTGVLSGDITLLKAETAAQKNGLTATNKRVDNVVIEAGTAAYEKVVDASKLIWKEPVAAFSDLAAAYPQPQNGWAVQTTSDGAVYRYDGSTWKKIQQVDAGPVNALDTRLTAQLAEISRNKVSVETYASSVVSGDWAPALMAAHDSLPEGGGVLNIPIQITIKTPVVLTKKVRLEGVGHTSISDNSTRATSVVIKDGNFDGITLYGGGSIIKSLQIDGAPGNGGDGLVVAGARISVEDVIVNRQGRDGIRIGNDLAVNANLWRLKNVLALNNVRHGLYIHDGVGTKSDTNAGYVMGIDSRRNGGDGICIGNSADNSFFAVATQHNVGVGIRMTSQCRGQYFYYPYSELNGAGIDREVLIESGSTRNFVQGQRSVIAYVSIMNLGGDSNMINYSNMAISGAPYYFDSPTAFKELIVKNNAVSGNWSMTQGSNRDLLFELKNTTTSNPISVEFKSTSTGPLTFKAPRLRVGDGTILTGWLHNSKTLNFSVISPGVSVDRTIQVPGVILGDTVVASPSGIPSPGLMWSAFVSAADTVTVRMANFTTASISTSDQVWRTDVFKHY